MKTETAPAPCLIRRHCGGWLAVSPINTGLKIGVASETESAARADYDKAFKEWTHNISN